MDRREIIRTVLGTGAMLVVEQVGGPASAMAASKAVQFYDSGSVTGAFAGWRLILAVTGQAVRGTLYNPATLQNGQYTGYRIRGNSSSTGLVLKCYELSDVSFASPVGAVTARRQGTGYSGTIVVGQQQGAVQFRLVKLSTSQAGRLSGTYFASLMQSTSSLPIIHANATLTVAPGSFQLTRIQDNKDAGVRLPTTTSGRWGITADGQVWIVVLLPDLTGVSESQITPSEVLIGRAGLNAPHAVVGARSRLLRDLQSEFCPNGCLGGCSD